jgi:hypothetical protein
MITSRVLAIMLAIGATSVGCSSSSNSSSVAAPTPTSSLPAPGTGDGVVNLRNNSNGLTFQEACLSAAGTYIPITNGNRVAIPNGSPWLGAAFAPICVRGSITPGSNFRIGADSDAHFTQGRASLEIDGAIFAVTIGSGTTNMVYPTLQ